jgi:hypothetical protein
MPWASSTPTTKTAKPPARPAQSSVNFLAFLATESARPQSEVCSAFSGLPPWAENFEPRTYRRLVLAALAPVASAPGCLLWTLPGPVHSYLRRPAALPLMDKPVALSQRSSTTSQTTAAFGTDRRVVQLEVVVERRLVRLR